ncbi:MFS transporter [Agrobacterium fabrum]|uniref:MFS transporter n=1 Tax=Agrobacterium fabrum TaxID=1176649 RepID=UPI003B9ECE8D
MTVTKTTFRQVLALAVPVGATQMALWGVLYYNFGVFIDPLARAFGWTPSQLTAVFSLSLLVSGLVAFPIGRWVDRAGAREALVIGAAASGALFLAWSYSGNFLMFAGCWMALGIASAAALQPSNAVYLENIPDRARDAIAISSLFTGLAATIFVPVGAYLIEERGWQMAARLLGLVCFVCAFIAAISIPASRRASRVPSQTVAREDISTRKADLGKVLSSWRFWAIGLALAANGGISTSLAVHLVMIMQNKGFGQSDIVATLALAGPAQIAIRGLLAIGGSRLRSNRTLGIIALTSQVVALLALWFSQPDGDFRFFIYLFGLANGIAGGLTLIVAALITTDVFGSTNYAAIQGVLKTISMLARAATPLALVTVTHGDPIGISICLVILAVSSVSAFAAAISVPRGPVTSQPG